MSKMLKIHGTTFTVGLFLVSAVSGTFLFFHIASSSFHAMHEWLSMLLLVPVGLHIWRNWASFSGYFKRKTIVVPLVLSIIAGCVFAYPSLSGNGRGGNPVQAAGRAMQRGTIAQIAPLYALTPDALSQRLQKRGYTVSSVNQTLTQIAKASGKKAGSEILADVAFAE